MGLLERARADAKRILGDLGGWATILNLEAPGGELATIPGTFFRRTIQTVNTEGRPTNARMAHITFAESELIPEYYSVRDARGRVHMEGHKVTCADSTGTSTTYVIREWHPDETLGIITCILGE